MCIMPNLKHVVGRRLPYAQIPPAVAAAVRMQTVRLLASRTLVVAACRPHGRTHAGCPSHLHKFVTFSQEPCVNAGHWAKHKDAATQQRVLSTSKPKRWHTFHRLKHRCVILWRGRDFPGPPYMAVGCATPDLLGHRVNSQDDSVDIGAFSDELNEGQDR